MMAETVTCAQAIAEFYEDVNRIGQRDTAVRLEEFWVKAWNAGAENMLKPVADLYKTIAQQSARIIELENALIAAGEGFPFSVDLRDVITSCRREQKERWERAINQPEELKQ